ncbi:MAG TPA: shikimate dehydrogenase [bacterium]|nr:shikimate dehydrogenase [bacterium]
MSIETKQQLPEIYANKRLCAIFGRPIAHSLSPLIHNHLFEIYKLPYYYQSFEIYDLKPAIDFVRSNNLRGVSITIPFKVEVMQYLDEIADLAKNIGAVNTIINENGKLIGDNTDAFGVINSFKVRNINLDNKNLVVLGCGGASRAVIYGLMANFKINKITIAGLSKELDDFVAEIKNKIKFHNIETFKLDNKKYTVTEEDDVIVNATSVGMHPKINETLIDAVNSEYINKIFFDVIYNPEKTLMLKNAEKSGAEIITGIDMFIYQALQQHYLWTGNTAKYSDIRHFFDESNL